MWMASLVFLGASSVAMGLAPPAKQHQPDTSRRNFFMKSALVASSSGAAMASLFPPFVRPARAYEVRVIGDDKPSPTMAAFNIQIRETTARLERDGFPLDSREDEAKRLSEAMASFSYESNSNSKKSLATKKPVYQKESKSTEK
jgi:hypothetical protein